MSKKVINLALIGTGKWGQNYIKTCKTLPGIDIAYIIRKSKRGIILKDLLAKKDIAGFIIATPTSTHFKIAKTLIENNKNVLIEKPITNSFRSTKALYDLAKKHPKSTVMAGHIQLYDPAYQEMKENIKKIGKIKRLKYTGLKSPKRNDVSVLWDWLPHPIYLFEDITKKTPELVSVQFIKPDNLRVSLSLSKNVIGDIHVGWTYPTKKRSFIIYGEKGRLTLRSSKKTKHTPLQNEVLAFVSCIKNKSKPRSNLNQALKIAKFISSVNVLIKH